MACSCGGCAERWRVSSIRAAAAVAIVVAARDEPDSPHVNLAVGIDHARFRLQLEDSAILVLPLVTLASRIIEIK